MLHRDKEVRNVRIGIGKTWCIHNGVNIATGVIAQLPTSGSIYLRRCQYRREFIAPLPTEKNIVIVKTSLRHWLQIPNLFIVPFPTAGRAVCSLGNLFPNSQQLYKLAL
jgi:hypothetical protein